MSDLAKKQNWTPEEIALARGFTPPQKPEPVTPVSRETLHLPEKAKRGRSKTGQ